MSWIGLRRTEKPQVSSESFEYFLEGVRKAPEKYGPSLGLEENVQFTNNCLTGAALSMKREFCAEINEGFPARMGD